MLVERHPLLRALVYTCVLACAVSRICVFLSWLAASGLPRGDVKVGVIVCTVEIATTMI